MADKKVKITQLPSAESTSSSVILINQNGVDKKADSSMFLSSENNLSEVNPKTARANLSVQSVEDFNEINNMNMRRSGSFDDGFTATDPMQIFIYNGDYYRWSGDFPKVVPASSTPDSSGGLGIGAWLSVGDATLRSNLASGDESLGDALIGVKQNFDGAILRTQDDKNAENISAQDAGAIGDGAFDDTAAFTALESGVTGRVIDLMGKTYLTTKTFYKNTYINGKWLVSGKTIPVNGELLTSKRPSWDVREIGRENNAAVRFIPVAQGRGSVRTLQSFAYDPVGRSYYSNHNTTIDGNATIVSIWNKYASDGAVINQSSDFMLPEDRLGHQGIAVQQTDSGTKIWTTSPDTPDGTPTHPTYDFSVGSAHGVVRFSWVSNTAGEIAAPDQFRLLEASRVAGSSTTPTITLDGKWMIVRFTDNADYSNQTFRVFSMDTFTDAGDYSAMCVHEFTLPLSSLGGVTTTSLSGFCSDGSHLYMYCGNTTFGSTQYIASCDLFGKGIVKAVSNLGDADLTRIIGTAPTYRESEGMHFVDFEGKVFPSVVIMADHADVMGGTRRTALVYALGAGGRRNANPQTAKVSIAPNPEKAPSTIDTGSTTWEDTGVTISSVRFNNPNGTGLNYEFQRSGVSYFQMYMSTTNVALLAANGADLHLGSQNTWRWKVSSVGNFHPYLDNAYSLGVPANRPTQLYAVNGTVNTSDARLKTEPREITAEEVSAFSAILRLPGVWKWLEKYQEEGNDARLHSGPTVQAAIAIMQSNNLDWTNYGAFCYDEWDDVYEPVMASRTITVTEGDDTFEQTQEYDTGEKKLVTAAGDRYSLRKDELLWWCMRSLASKVDDHESRLKAIEEKK